MRSASRRARRSPCVSFLLIMLAVVPAHRAYILTKREEGARVVTTSLPPAEAKRIIAKRAHTVIRSLQTANMTRLSAFVHPQKGVRFSPYASVLPDEDRVIQRKALSSMWVNNRRYKWGAYDGSGDPIRLTFRKYFRQFVFDRDYTKVKDVRYNPESMSHGNTPNNIREIYPEAIAVEYFIAGVDPKRDGMDWTSLWLVFEKRASEWYLIGIVHDEWTI